MEIRELPQIVAITNYSQPLSSRRRNGRDTRWYSAATLFGILDLAREVLSSYKKDNLESSCCRHICGDIKWVKGVNPNL